MSPIKIILMVLLVLLLRAFLVQKSLVLVKRIFGILLFLILAFLVIFPDVSTDLAEKVGVGRGVDLVFYLSHLFLLFLIVVLWRRSTVLMADLTRLSRELAIKNAKEPQQKE
ncbi:MAG: DUF2304 family protein [Planctomycetota bacterium]|jgi:hypothetical protein